MCSVQNAMSSGCAELRAQKVKSGGALQSIAVLCIAVAATEQEWEWDDAGREFSTELVRVRDLACI